MNLRCLSGRFLSRLEVGSVGCAVACGCMLCAGDGFVAEAQGIYLPGSFRASWKVGSAEGCNSAGIALRLPLGTVARRLGRSGVSESRMTRIGCFLLAGWRWFGLNKFGSPVGLWGRILTQGRKDYPLELLAKVVQGKGGLRGRRPRGRWLGAWESGELNHGLHGWGGFFWRGGCGLARTSSGVR